MFEGLAETAPAGGDVGVDRSVILQALSISLRSPEMTANREYEGVIPVFTVGVCYILVCGALHSVQVGVTPQR